MGALRMEKLNQLLKEWPKGKVRVSSYLQNLGYQKDLLKKYVSSNWLQSLGYGAYKLASDPVEWYGAISALQEQKNSNIHPGGKTALELRGYGHYIKQGEEEIYLYGNRKDSLPKWFIDQKWSHNINSILTNLFEYNKDKYRSDISINNVDIKVSIPELAAMEILYLVPKEQSFEEAYLIMENLTTLRPKFIQQLLEECNSVKVKRIFMWMAEQLNHEWVNDLKLQYIDFGKGKRVIVKDGTLTKKYNITVPRIYEG